MKRGECNLMLAVKERLLVEAVRKKSHAVGVTSEWVCEYGRARYIMLVIGDAILVGLCHHGMARPQVADIGTASDKECSCVCIE